MTCVTDARCLECFAVPLYLQPYASSCQVCVQFDTSIYLYTEPLRPQSSVEVIGQEDNDYYTVAMYMQGLIPGCSQAFPIFHRPSTSVYYTECKPKNNKQERPVGIRCYIQVNINCMYETFMCTQVSVCM